MYVYIYIHIYIHIYIYIYVEIFEYLKYLDRGWGIATVGPVAQVGSVANVDPGLPNLFRDFFPKGP